MRPNSGRPSGRATGQIRRSSSSTTRRCVVAACVAFGLVAGAATARASAGETTGARWLGATAESPGLLVFPPQGDPRVPRAVTIMLHGMCDVPERECPWFAEAVTPNSWLVCPRGPLRCESGGATWAWERRAETIDAAIRRVEAEYPGRVAAGTDDTLIGFSLGAFVAMDVVNHAPTRWSRVVLLGAKVTPDRRALLRGSTRFVLGAGDLDASRVHMELAARRLHAAGVDATFMSLGRVGHRFADDMDGWLARALAPTE